jgi:hypothetical protein
MVNEKGEMHWVQCRICTVVEGKEKLLAPKLDILQKHISHRKAKVSIPRVDPSSYYMNKNLYACQE